MGDVSLQFCNGFGGVFEELGHKMDDNYPQVFFVECIMLGLKSVTST